MTDSYNRCYQCMHEIKIGTTICPNCNYPIAKNLTCLNILKPGTILANRYIVGNVIEKNQENITYIAFDKHLDVKVSVKEFFPMSLATRLNSKEVIPNDKDLELFNKINSEFISIFSVLSKFRTMPNILKIYSSFSENNTSYVIQEYPSGITLRRYLSNNYGELSWSKSSSMFIELIKSMQHLHNTGIIHCGLSPETILVENEKLKIIGFSTIYLRTNTSAFPCELYDGYAAPEQYENNYCGPWTDVYGIAAVMYKTLTGTMPIASNTRSSNDNLIAPDILNSHVPKNVSLAIMSALTLSPKLRTQTLEDFYADTVTPLRSTQKQSIEFTNQNLKIESKDFYGTIPKKPEIKTSKLVFITMVVSTSIVMLSLAIIMFLLFGEHLFG